MAGMVNVQSLQKFELSFSTIQDHDRIKIGYLSTESMTGAACLHKNLSKSDCRRLAG